MLRFLTAGESHGKCLTVIIDGLPAGFDINSDTINAELASRQKGYGRGGRMKIENDKINITSGVRHGKTTGAPLAAEIANKDWKNWQIPMSIEAVPDTSENILKILEKEISNIRPGHADFAGAIKYNHEDIRDILERSSARETAARVAVGAIAENILSNFGIVGFSHIVQIGKVKLPEKTPVNIDKIRDSVLSCTDEKITDLMKQEITKAKENGDTLGGTAEIVFKNIPVGLGSHVQWDRRADGLLAQALMSIPAVKAVEIGIGTRAAETYGHNTHDEIFKNQNGIYRKTNNAGGIEGGMTNGEDILIRVTMKAIPTMKAPLSSINLKTGKPYKAHFERSDTCAVPACGIVAKNMVAIVLLNLFLEKFGSDSFSQIKTNFDAYLKMLSERLK